MLKILEQPPIANEKMQQHKKNPYKKRCPKKITESYLYNSGLYYLQRFTSSTANFRRVMKNKVDRSCASHKDQDPEECMALLDQQIIKFQDQGLLNDPAYTAGMVNSLRRRGMARKAIIARLRTKGLPQEMIVEALTNYDDENGCTEDADLYAAMTLARRRKLGPFSTQKTPDTNRDTNSDENHEKAQAQYKRIMGIFSRAGFSFDIAKKVLEMNLDEANHLIESRNCLNEY